MIRRIHRQNSKAIARASEWRQVSDFRAEPQPLVDEPFTSARYLKRCGRRAIARGRSNTTDEVTPSLAITAGCLSERCPVGHYQENHSKNYSSHFLFLST